MSMVYGDWNRGGEHYTSANQKAAWSQQAAAAQQQDAADWERGREMFERSMAQQEQARRGKDSDNALALGQKKYDVLSGLLGKMGGSSGFGPQMMTPGFSWSAGHMYSTSRPSRRSGPSIGGGGYEKQ